MRLVYHSGYHLNLGDHVFPSMKFQLIRDKLVQSGAFTEDHIIPPTPATDEELMLVHDPQWINALTHGTLTMEQILRLEIPYSQPMVQGFKLMAGGSILAARLALEDGISANIGGGFHHAFPGHGEGFCAIHDAAVAVRVLQREGRIRKALFIDCDCHHGNGTAAIFADDPSVFTISLHQYNNYPLEKPPSNIDVHLPDGTGDEKYLLLLHEVYIPAVENFQPDLIMYIAGADPYKEDQLGGLRLTIEGLQHRDEVILSLARQKRIPAVITFAGGYARRLEDTVTIHANTVIQAKRLAG